MIFTVCSDNGSRNGGREDPEVWLCVEGGRVGCFDQSDVVWVRNTQQPRVYALEGEFIYLQGQQMS